MRKYQILMVMTNDDSTYNPDEDENDDDDDDSGFDDNNEANEPTKDNIHPPGPVINDAVNDDTEAHNDLPVPDDGESQGGVVSGDTDAT